MDLVPLYREMAETGTQFHGLSIMAHRELIGKLIEFHKAKTLLDFGCGRGDAYYFPYQIHRDWGVSRPTLYDPAFMQHDELPPLGERFDGVLCSDVLEHVPEEDVRAFIEGLFARAKKFVWASVCCRPAKKTFADGTNLHVTIQPYLWWVYLFKSCAPKGVAWTLVETK